MKVVITGDVNRPGQEVNIDALANRVQSTIGRAFGVIPKIVKGQPISFRDWVRGYEKGPFPHIEADVVIGFEIPPCAKRVLPCWVDVRRSPIRFIGEFYSVQSNFLNVSEVVASFDEGPFPTQASGEKQRGLGVFALQVHNDSSLIRDGKFVGPWSFETALHQWAHGCDLVVVSPHPMEPFSPWEDFVLQCLRDHDNVVIRDVQGSEDSIYPLLAEAERVVAVSSSVGIEAPYFNCEPTYLWKPPEYSAPVNIDRVELWHGVADVIREAL